MNSTLARLAFGLLVGLGSSPAGAQNYGFDLHDKDQPFEPGHSCAELGYLSDAELKEALSPAFQSDFHAFCRPEEPQVCSDYTPELKGFGRLVAGDDGYHCQFVPVGK